MNKGKKLSYIILGIGILVALVLLGFGFYYYYHPVSGVSYKGHVVGLEPIYGVEKIAISSAKVKIVTFDQKVVASVISDQKGDFIFKNTPIGDYVLHIEPSQKDAKYYDNFIASVGFFKDNIAGKETYFPDTISLIFRSDFLDDSGVAKDFKYVLGPAFILYKAQNGFYPKFSEEPLINGGPLLTELKNFMNPAYQLPSNILYGYQSKNNGQGFNLIVASKTGNDFYHLLKEIDGKKYYILDENYKEVLGL